MGPQASAADHQRIDYDTFHKAVESVLLPASDAAKQMPHIPVDAAPDGLKQRSAAPTTASTVIQKGDFDLGLEFETDDPTTRAAKREVCRKVRTQLQSHLTMPRKAFLTVDKNRDGLLSRQELRRCEILRELLQLPASCVGAMISCLRSGLRKVGVELSEHEMDYLMDAVDKERTGVINYSKFVKTFFPADTDTEFGAHNASSLLFTSQMLKTKAKDTLEHNDIGELIDELGMLHVHAGNVDGEAMLTASERVQQQYHGPVPYFRDEVPRDVYGVPVSAVNVLCYLSV